MGMSIYQIDAAMMELIDEETGEIKDFEAFEQLALDRDNKIENTGRMYKNYKAEAEAIREEEKNLAKRRKVCENNMERLKNLLDYALGGEKYKSAAIVASYRKASSVEVNEDEFLQWAKENAPQYLRYKDPEVSKTEIGNALKNGIEVPFAAIVERMSLSIK